MALQIPDSATTTTNGVTSYINGHFSKDSEKARAAFIWLAQIRNPDASTANLIINFRKQIGDLTACIDEQQDWLKKYFSKGKGGRRSMFTKYTWFGIPPN